MSSQPLARHLLRARDLADARYAEPLTVADLARAAGLSPAHFSREFKRAFGESPHQYLLTRRLERAAALLRVTDWSVADVCFAVGAGSVGSFTTSFGPGLRPVTHGLPPLVAAGGSLRPDSALRGHGLRPAAEPHVSRRPGDSRFVGFLPVALAHLRRIPMIRIANAQFWVHDQDEALRFYTRTLGWEVRADVSMQAWNFRWLAVGPPGQDDVGLVLMPVPGTPMLDPDSSAALAGLVAMGAGGTLFLETDDCQASYDELSARGVTFNDPPTAQPYGIDTSFRDPSGNNIRLTQVLEFDPARGTAP